MATHYRVALAIAIALAATWWQPAPATLAAPLPQVAPCATAAAVALAQRGKDYVWGAKGPDQFDCSGLTSYVWGLLGQNIGPSTYDQARAGVYIPCTIANLAGSATTCWEAGDLIFLRYTGGQHVAMYIGQGLFADAYNPSTGVIVHAVESDIFYRNHFWQARRIVDCDGVSVDPGSADSLGLSQVPGLEDIPDLLPSLAFSVPQCGECNPDGSIILPAGAWAGTWPSGADLLNVGLVFQTVIDWLAYQIGEMFRTLICWLLNMLALAAGFGQSAINVLIYGLNGLWKMFVLLWLSLRAYFLNAWAMLEAIRAMLYVISAGMGGLAEFGQLILAALALVAGFFGQLVTLFGQLGIAALGVIGWIGGLALGLIYVLQLAIVGTNTPAQLTDTHVIYRGVRGLLEGFRDSDIGWALYVLWGMAYVAFVLWLNRFLSASKEDA